MAPALALGAIVAHCESVVIVRFCRVWNILIVE